VEVRHDDSLCVAYQARWSGPFLVVRATVGAGWHTFAMDNKKRLDEKLAGKPALSMDRPTEIVAAGGLEIAGPWYQSPPVDFSHPELRWFSWGFDRQAVFAAKARAAAGAPARLRVRGQACTQTTCKNIDVAIPVPVASAAGSEASDFNLKDLVQVR
jgi:hypothetical protein